LAMNGLLITEATFNGFADRGNGGWGNFGEKGKKKEVRLWGKGTAVDALGRGGRTDFL